VEEIREETEGTAGVDAWRRWTSTALEELGSTANADVAERKRPDHRSTETGRAK
jgi:hypothetical protein